tara:strand:+ start:1520 stop:5917 length:4398 start_codon:yes stop_codon:yes gene_type:complete
MNKVEPIYLRYVYDGLSKGSISANNATSLPIGFIGLFEDEFPSSTPLVERMSVLNKLAIWALFKGPVSIEMVAEVLNEHPDNTKALIDTYSKWFNSPEPGKYVLYHDRLRTYLLQKLSEHEIQELNETLISYLEKVLSDEKGDESEIYALEHLSTHMLVESQLDNNYKRFHDYVNKDVLWPRQISVSKEYKWSQKSIQQSIKEAARRQHEDNTIGSTINSVNLNLDEQSSIQNILTFFYDSEYLIVVERIKRLEIKNRYLLSIFMITEIISESLEDLNEKKEICQLFISSINEIKGHGLDWYNDFPVMLMYRNHLILKELDINDSCFWHSSIPTPHYSHTSQFGSYIEGLLNVKKRNELASIFKQKISEIKQLDKIKYLDDFDVTINGKYDDGSESTSEYKLHYVYAYLSTHDKIFLENIDLFDIIELWKYNSVNNYEDLFIVLNYHLERSQKSTTKSIVKKENYYSLPKDEIISIISKLFVGAKDGYNESKGSKERGLRIRLHKILNENSIIRSEKFKVNFEFKQDKENKLLLINLCKEDNNVFNRLLQIREICEAVQFNQNEKKYIEKDCKYDIENSNMHTAHLATAYTYFANILTRLNNPNSAYDNYVKAIINKKELFKTNTGAENIKSKVGDVELVLNDSIRFCSNSNLNKDKRPRLLNMIKSLTKMYVEIEFEKSNLLTFTKKIKDENEFEETWGFNSLINQFLVSFQTVNNEVLFENLFKWFKIYLDELDLKFLLEINQDSINYLESYLNTGLMLHSGYFKGFDNFKNNDSVLESNLTINNIAWAPIFNVNEISRNENIVSNMILIYQNFIQFLLEKKLYNKAVIYFKEYLENYDFKKFKHKSLELIFQNSLFKFIKILLKNPRFLNGKISSEQSSFYSFLISKIPESNSCELILENKIFYRLTELYEFSYVQKNIFDCLTSKIKAIDDFEILITYLEALLNINLNLIADKKNKKYYEEIIDKSMLTIKNQINHQLNSNSILFSVTNFNRLFLSFNNLAKEIIKTNKEKTSSLLDDQSISSLVLMVKNNVSDVDITSLNILIEFMQILDRENESIFLKSIKNERLNNTYLYVVSILTDGYLTYNPFENKYRNDGLSNFGNLLPAQILSDYSDQLSEDQLDYILQISPMLITKSPDGKIDFDDSSYQNDVTAFDYAYMLLKMERFQLAIDTVDSINNINIKSLFYFSSTKLLLEKNKYNLAKKIIKIIKSSYFLALSLLELYKYYHFKKNHNKCKITFDLILQSAADIKFSFQKSDLFYESYKYFKGLNEINKAEVFKSKIDNIAYKLCVDIFDCEALIKRNKISKADNFFKVISDEYKNQENKNKFPEYGSNLGEKYNRLNQLIKGNLDNITVFYDENNDQLFQIDHNEEIKPEFYLNFFDQCNFQWVDGDGCGVWRDELRRLSRLREIDKIKCMAESIKFARFTTYDSGLNNCRLIQSEIFIELGDYKKAFLCLPSLK